MYKTNFGLVYDKFMPYNKEAPDVKWGRTDKAMETSGNETGRLTIEVIL